MADITENVLKDVALRVARRVAEAHEPSSRLPERYTLLALSGDGAALDEALRALERSTGEVVVVADCSVASSRALAAARASLPRARVVDSEAPIDPVALAAGAERVLAPALDLALASRLAAMQADSPASSVVLRALLAGVEIEASLAERDFASPSAPEGARRALAAIVAKLGAIGIAIGERPKVAIGAAAPYAKRVHPSQERFDLKAPLGEFVEFLESRPCSIETGKPCIDCGVCEARGF